MGTLTTTLLIIGILMFLEGSIAVLFPKYSKQGIKLFIKFMKSTEKHLKAWGIGEIIVAIILIILGLKL